MLQEPGPDLDHEVARRLGEEGLTLSYSTDLRAADELTARLAKLKVVAVCERFGTLWYCALSIDFGHARERLATGTGKTRPLALCRAVMNLPPESLHPPAAPHPQE